MPSPRALVLAIALSSWSPLGCTTGTPYVPPPPDAGPEPDAGPTCVPGRTACDGYTFYRCGEDGRAREDELSCEGGCHPEDGCVPCEPGSRRCEDGVSRVCSSDSRWAVVRDCGEWGSTCGFGGVCQDACGVAEQSRLNVGCVFYPVPLANYFEGFDGDQFDFRVAVANPSEEPVVVTVTRGTQRVARITLAPGRMELITLPWIEGQSDGIPSGRFEGLRAPGGMYRLTSDRPVTVFQFNPFEYQASGGERSYSNDASLLFPAHALTGDYVVSSYRPLEAHLAGYLAIGAVDAEETVVRVTSPVAIAADRDGSWERTAAGEELVLTLSPGELVYLLADLPPPCDPALPEGRRCAPPEHDLTGARVHADHPVIAFGGHVCANVPSEAGTCDHLESQLAPVETLGSRFASAPLVEPGSGYRNLVRVVAAFDGTRVTADPPLALSGPDGAPLGERALAAGEWAEAFVTAPFTLETSQPSVVTQYLLGAGDPAERATSGDPSMTLLVPVEQYHHEYVFSTPSSYRPAAGGQSYVLVIREPGSPVTLDGAPIAGPWTRIGAHELRVLEVDGGVHRLRGDRDVGAMVYGLGKDTSYAYPAGMDLERIVIPF